jgi:hypothetical protein
VSSSTNTIELLDRAQNDVRDLTGEDRYLWVAANDRLRTNSTPAYSLADPQFTSGPPIDSYVNIGNARVIVVEYKRYDKNIVVIGVRFYDHHRESPTR